MGKIKSFLLPFVFLALSIALLVFGFVKLDVINGFDIKNLFVDVSKILPSVRSNDEIVNELKTMYLSNSFVESKKELPENLNAVWFDCGRDVSASVESGIQAITDSLYIDFDFYRNFIPNAFFIVPDTQGKFSGLKENDGSDFVIEDYVVSNAKSLGCSIFLVVNDDALLDGSGFTFEKIKHYLDLYPFDGVLMSAESLYGKDTYYDAVKFISDKLNTDYPDVFFGAEIHTDVNNGYSDSYVIKVFSEKLIDFGYVDCFASTRSQPVDFGSVAYYWNYFSESYNIPLFCEHRTDLVFTNDEEWGFGTEINDQLKVLFDLPSFDGSCYYRASSLKNKKTLARDLSIFLNNYTGSYDAFAVTSLKLSGESAVLSGVLSPSGKVFLNDAQLALNGNRFNLPYDLSPGMNDLRFFADGKTYSYSLYNNRGLFVDHSEQNEIYMNSEGIFTCFAVCPENSIVFAVVNGNSYQLTEFSGVNGVPHGFSYFACSVKFASADLLSNELTLLCMYNGIAETAVCGNVSDSTAEHIVSTPVSVPFESAPSVFADNGLGTSLMCILNCDNTEQISTPDDYDTYHPDNSSLLKGTIDYVDKITVSDEGYLVYQLKSGINVYGVDAILVNNGYNLPLNTSVITSFDSSEKETKIVIDTDWLSPVTVTPEELDYKKGYQSFSYNLEDFDAEYFDLTLYYTDTLEFDDAFDFTSSSVFSRYEVYENNDSIVIRLYLREKGKFYGFDILQNDSGEVEVIFKNRSVKSVEGKVVMIDAGHGGLSMVGTAVHDNSVSEATVTLAIAQKTKEYLEDMGAVVVMTRTLDSSLSLYERAVMCETVNPDIFISIHCDGSEAASESGTHTFYYTPYSQPLAESIHTSLVDAYLNRIYTIFDRNYQAVDRKIKYYPFYVTRVDNCPSVLIETGFMTNYVEGNVLINPTHQSSIAKGIADGIYNYFIQN